MKCTSHPPKVQVFITSSDGFLQLHSENCDSVKECNTSKQKYNVMMWKRVWRKQTATLRFPITFQYIFTLQKHFSVIISANLCNCLKNDNISSVRGSESGLAQPSLKTHWPWLDLLPASVNTAGMGRHASK